MKTSPSQRLSLVLCLACLSTALLVSGCTRSRTSPAASAGGPEEVVKTFVEISGSAKDPADKRRLEELTSGELRRALAAMSEESFRMNYLGQGIKIRELKLVEVATEKERARVHYQIAIDNPAGTDTTAEVNEREVELKQSQGVWYIETIRTKGSDKLAFVRGMIF